MIQIFSKDKISITRQVSAGWRSKITFDGVVYLGGLEGGVVRDLVNCGADLSKITAEIELYALDDESSPKLDKDGCVTIDGELVINTDTQASKLKCSSSLDKNIWNQIASDVASKSYDGFLLNCMQLNGLIRSQQNGEITFKVQLSFWNYEISYVRK